MNAQAPTPTSKFLHLFTTHPPYVYQEGCVYAGRELEISAENDFIQATCALERVAALLMRLREIGVYDNSAIAIISDHGNYLLESRRASSPSRASLIGSANPTFAFKPVQSEGPIEVRQNEVHIGDFGATLCDGLQVCSVPQGVSALSPSGARTRVFYDYRWENDFWSADSIETLKKYEINGPIGSLSSWSLGAELPVGEPMAIADMDNAGDFLISGWGGLEGWGVWSIAESAYLAFTSPPGAGAVRVRARGFVADGIPRRTVSVSYRGQELASIPFSLTDSKVEFDIPLPDDRENVVELEFRITDPVSPKFLGLSEDTRNLGIGLEAISFLPENKPTSAQIP
ncbi:hypothetical protein VE25_04995 [Devosia geojensis]|uniref:Sulfatase N-terminal domain-containing protein n=2 Tax=Devosia geojensis TaxID=443610 RepID=A0A0F5FVM3_9HYPH|nr:hypothetical protein VE25_04995 [Devosia geojensis]